MRHRRRLHTQTLRKKSSRTTTQPAYSQQKKRSGFGRFFFFILLAAAIVYSILYYDDHIKPVFDSFFVSTNTEIIDQPSQQNNTQDNDEINETIPAMPSDKQPAHNDDVFYSPIQKKIQLEILNGCGEQGVAKKLSDILRQTNYDVVNSGNYIQNGKVNWEVEKTKIIDQVGLIENATELANFMGVANEFVDSYDNPSPIADMTIIIGKDYKDLPVFK